MSKHNSTNATTFLKYATAVSGIGCGLLTAWLTLELLSSSDSPIFMRRDTTSVVASQTARVKLTVYYPPHLGAAPNPPSESLTQDVPTSRGLPSEDLQRLQSFIDELATALGPDVIIQPGGTASDRGGTACGSRPGNSEDSTIGRSSVAQESQDSLNRDSSPRWPPARHVPLTINWKSDVADHKQFSAPAIDCAALSWEIVFPQGTHTDQGVSRVLAALSSLKKNHPVIVANHLKTLAEIDNQLRELGDQYPRTLLSLLGVWREKRSQMYDFVLLTLQNRALWQTREDDPILAELQATRASLLRRRQQLLMTHTAEHPEAKQVESLLAEIEQEIQLRTRRRREYPVSREDESGSVPGHETTWLPLQPVNSIGSSPSSLGAIAAERKAESSGRRETDGELLQRFTALRSAMESYDTTFEESLKAIQVDIGKLQERLTSVCKQLDEALTDWELGNACVIEPDLESSLRVNDITRHPTLWSLFLALVTGLFAHGAVVALISGLAERQYIGSAEQLSAITNGPVFQISLSRETRIVDKANPISSPHFSMAGVEMGNSPNQNV